MFQTRTPAAGQGRGRPSLGRGRGRIPAADVPVTVELQETVAESAASGTGNGIAERHTPQRVQSDDSGYVIMRGPDFRAYIRQVEGAFRVGGRTPDLPAHGESFEGLHRITQVPVEPTRAAEITQVPEEYRRSEKR